MPDTLKLNDIYSCIQGEGCQAGTAMVIVRLQGCGVGCPWCDTKETWTYPDKNKVDTIDAALGTNTRWCEVSPFDIATYVGDRCPGPKWVLLTGGEPSEQPVELLDALVADLHRRGYKVAIETSGTADGHVGVPFDWTCVSPKVGMPGGKPILPASLAVADEVKMVIGTQKDIDTLCNLLPGTRTDAHICLQPVSMSPRATELCTETAIRNGWRVSVQVHKVLGQR